MEAIDDAFLTVSQLEVTRGARPSCSGVSFAVERGEIVALMGASGAGKTSVLRAIAGLDPIAAGGIDIDGLRSVLGGRQAGHARRELHRRVGMVFQFHHLFEHLTALHNVWLAPVHVLRSARKAAEREALELLDQLGVGARAHAMPHELSGGEAQRVAIARALADGAAAPADGRAHGIARPGASRRSRRHPPAIGHWRLRPAHRQSR